MIEDITSLQIRVSTEGVDSGKRALDGLSNQAGKAETALEKVGRVSFSALKTGISAVGVAASGILAAGAATATREWLKYDKAIKEVNSITGQTRAEFQKTRKDVLDLAQAIGVDATEAARGLYQAISAGIPQENALKFLEVASKTAIAGVTSVDVAVDGLTNTLNAFKIPVGEAEAVADKLFQTVVLGKTTFEELSRNLSKASVPAAALGIDLDELLAVIVGITSQGTPTAEAFTQVKASITALLDPSEEMAAVYESLGVESGRAAIKQLGFAGTLQAVRTAYNGNDAALVKALRSSEAYNGVLSVTGENLEKVKTATDGVANSTGSMSKAYAVNSKTLEKSLNSLKASAISLVETVEASFGIFEKLGDMLQDISRGIDRISGGGISNATTLALKSSEMGGGAGVNVIQTRIAEVEVLKKKFEEAKAAGEDFIDGSILSTGTPVNLGLELANRDLEALRANLEGVSDQSLTTAAAMAELAAIQEQFDAGAISASEYAERQLEVQERLNGELATQNKYEAQRVERMGILEQRKQRELDATKAETDAAKEKAEVEKDILKVAEKTAETAIASLQTEEEALQIEIQKVEKARELGLLTEAQSMARKAQLQEEIRLVKEKKAEEEFGSGVLPPKEGGGLFGSIDTLEPFVNDEALDELQQDYEKRREIILNETSLTEEERLRVLREAEEDYTALVYESQSERAKKTLSSFGSFFSDIETIGKAYGRKGAKIAKAAAVAGATVQTASNAITAYGRGLEIPYIGAYVAPIFAGVAVAAGAAQIATINATDYAGAYARGGIVPGSSFAGDNLTANVNSGEMILNRAQQARLFDAANGRGSGGGGSNVNISIINNAPGVEIERRESENAQGKQIELIVKKMSSDIARGGNPLANSLEKTFNLRRA